MRILFFHSRTCRSCRRQREEFKTKPPGVEVKKIDVTDDDAPMLMRRYHVTDVPTSILVKDDGAVVRKWVDFIRSENIKEEIVA